MLFNKRHPQIRAITHNSIYMAEKYSTEGRIAMGLLMKSKPNLSPSSYPFRGSCIRKRATYSFASLTQCVKVSMRMYFPASVDFIVLKGS